MIEVKQYWPINSQTKEVQPPIEAQKRGGTWHISKNALLNEPVSSKEGYAVVAIFDENGIPVGSELIEDHRSSGVYKISNCAESKVITELGPIEDGWTELEPSTHFDVWKNGQWVLNEQAKYEAEVLEVSNKRQALYQTMVDPLNKEAAMARRIEVNEDKAQANEAQADAAYLKIRDENPWPIPLTK
ncbi:hypothetical protein [Vibrio sp. 10N.261.55.A7]|uniref:hypothetical protein n=1 Tax=Vibrio sp. 10N.261.55.A7 TaxID=1880851 RepID=UPI000C81704D|nr:hypothetical protein [Vibrio sp. 10N.261.55.A7]PMJ90296.1 hypothetical protein BCU12_12450 [Vibrio sp. 10N.261.55.A7]